MRPMFVYRLVLAVALLVSVFSFVQVVSTHLFDTRNFQETEESPQISMPLPKAHRPQVRVRQPLSSRIAKRLERLIPLRREIRVNCANIINGDVHETIRARDLAAHLANIKQSNPLQLYLQARDNCSAFRRQRGYVESPLSGEESDFPIAFSIVMYTDMEMAERLLRAIYRPQNFYCIHVDQRETVLFHAAQSLATCFPNVVLAHRRIPVPWGTFAVLEADIICMETLWQFMKWKYFINLTGRDFPLKTNYELVQILKALNGSNDVHGTLRETYDQWFRFESPPSWFRPIKGSVHVALSKAFVNYTLHDPTAAKLLEWVKANKAFQDEMFFSTLNHNPHLRAPGSFKGYPEFIPKKKPFLSRYKIWNTTSDYYCHSSHWVRHICILSTGDLPLMLRSVHLFANKFFLQEDRLAISCLEEYLLNRTREQFLLKKHMDTSFYANLDAVKYQVYVA